MKLRRKTVVLGLVAAAAAVLIAGLVAPLVDADRFGARVKSSLQAALGREVEIGKVHLDVFNGPGFSVDNVVVHDDPAAGIEPLAYVESLEAVVSLKSFYTRRLEFSSLRLVNASVNLVRPERGHWNFLYLLSRTAGAASARVRLPEIQVRSSRINFKLGDTKSIFYLADARLDATGPSSPDGEWRLRFEGEPARTDRGSQGFGRFTVRGRWQPGPQGGRIDAALEVENSSISDLMRLVHGHDIGVHGRVSSRARFAGPLADVQITGRIEIGDFHRWDLLPPRGQGWPLDYRGKLDLQAETLQLETVPPAGGTLPISLAFRTTGFLSRPRWAALIKLDRLPFAPLPEVARHMGLALPDALTVAGDLTGVIGYTPDSGLQGTVASGEASVAIPNTPPLEIETAHVRLDSEAAHLEPAVFKAREQTGAVEGDFSWTRQAWSARITAGSMDLGADTSGTLFGVVPVLEQCTKGSWKGQLEYRKDGDLTGRWTGAFRIENASVPVTGLAEPLEVANARVILTDDGAVIDHMAGRVGAIDFHGEYRYAAGATRPHQLRLTIPKLDAPELERVLLPSLRRDDTLLARALRLGRVRVPEWLEARRAEAALEIGSTTVGDLALERVRTHVRWDGTTIEAGDLAARLGDAAISGRMTINLRRSVPAYRLTARFRNLNWMGGKWAGRSVVLTSGTGPELIGNLKMEGTFNAASMALSTENEAKDVSGAYAFSMANGLPIFRFSDLAMTMGEASFKGKGETGADGRLVFDLTDGQTQMRLNATLSPFAVEFLPVRAPGTL